MSSTRLHRCFFAYMLSNVPKHDFANGIQVCHDEGVPLVCDGAVHATCAGHAVWLQAFHKKGESAHQTQYQA